MQIEKLGVYWNIRRLFCYASFLYLTLEVISFNLVQHKRFQLAKTFFLNELESM